VRKIGESDGDEVFEGGSKVVREERIKRQGERKDSVNGRE